MYYILFLYCTMYSLTVDRRLFFIKFIKIHQEKNLFRLHIFRLHIYLITHSLYMAKYYCCLVNQNTFPQCVIWLLPRWVCYGSANQICVLAEVVKWRRRQSDVSWAGLWILTTATKSLVSFSNSCLLFTWNGFSDRSRFTTWPFVSTSK